MMRLLLMTNACRMVSGRRFVFLPMCFRTPSREFGIRQGEHRDTQSFIVSRLKWSTQSLSRSFASGLEVTFANGVSGREASRKRCVVRGASLTGKHFPAPMRSFGANSVCSQIHPRKGKSFVYLCVSPPVLHRTHVPSLPRHVELVARPGAVGQVLGRGRDAEEGRVGAHVDGAAVGHEFEDA